MEVNIPTLIQEVRLRRALWDQKDPTRKDKVQMNKLWIEVAKKCGCKRIIVRNKWKRLRESFRNHLKKCKHKKFQWAWFKELSFLTGQMPNLEEEDCNCNDKKEDQPPVLTLNEEGSSTDDSNFYGCYDSPPDHRDFMPENFPEIQTSNDPYRVQSVSDTDANYYFLMSLLPQMSSLPALKQMLLRLKIHQLLVQEVVANEDESAKSENIMLSSD